ncbi:Telomerase reverse transcriptase [Acorus gramineus]|uniref:Telomerase reverse transcriptase n=1 Tax=Acorus gramineus TaxID=55184 RepID=A0AAV9AMF2_ACOGR|nr:Telomerase reverse transcriptase [Acorus gramineus]
MARKRRRLPEVLHRAYGHRARVLSDTILSLLSPPPSAPEDECRTCGGRGCLGCRGASHLIRTGDNSEYVRLMTRGIAVVSDGAPPPPAFRFRNHRAQRLIVRNVMEAMVDWR